MAYTPYYSGGWQSGEEGDTPITPAALNHMEDGIAAAALAADGESWTYTYNNASVLGLTIEMWQNKLIPRLVKLKITGTTTIALQTSAGYQSLWQNSTLAAMNISNHISFEMFTGIITGQLYIESGGLIKIGYTRDLYANASANVPSGATIYWQKTMMLSA